MVSDAKKKHHEMKQIIKEHDENTAQAVDYIAIMLGKRMSTEGGPLVSRPAFDMVAALAIVCNSIFMGTEVAVMSERVDRPLWIDLASFMFTAFFTVEVMLRMKTYGLEFFYGENKGWHLFDLFLVITGITDSILMIAISGDKSALGFMKALKMLRILRLVRVFRFFRQLSTLAVMIIDSMSSLFWSLVLFFLIVFIFSMTLTSIITEWLKKQLAPSGSDWHGDLRALDSEQISMAVKYFGSLERTMYTLLQMTTNGVSWGELTTLCMNINWMAGVLAVVYVLFAIIAMLNVFTGVFVDNAVQNAKKQKDAQLEAELESRRQWVERISEFFMAADEDGSGVIDLEETRCLLESPSMNTYFKLIGFDFSDSSRLFSTFDKDGSGAVSFSEFVEGCEKMRGPARSVDVQMLAADVNHMLQRLENLVQHEEKVVTQHSAHAELKTKVHV